MRRSPDGTFCHLFGWRRVVQRTWGHRPEYLIAEQGGSVVGILPIFEVRSVFGRALVSTPNAVYGGALGDTATVRQALVDAAKRLAIEVGAGHVEFRDSNPATLVSDPEVRRKDLYFTFEHPISTDENGLLRSFPPDVRRMIRQGGKAGLTTEIGQADLLDDFYDIYAESVHNLGTPVFPKRLFKEFLGEFPEQCDVLLVRQEGRAAGAVMSFYFAGSVLPYYGGARREFYRTGINNFMYWELMRSAAARGCTRFDFGRSKEGTGAFAFKRGWGMTPRPLPYGYFVKNGDRLPNINPTNRRLRVFIETWKRLPVGLTKWLGPPLSRHFP